jgi:hypothetical protein
MSEFLLANAKHLHRFFSSKSLVFEIQILIEAIVLVFILASCTNAVPNYTGTSQSPVLAIVINGSVNAVYVGNQELVTIDGTCERTDLPISLWVDGSKVEGEQASCVDYKFQFIYNSSLLTEGTHSMHISITPTANTVSSTQDVALIKDVTLPNVITPNLNELASNGALISSSTYVVAWIAADGTGSPISFYTLEQFVGTSCSGTPTTYSGIEGLAVVTMIGGIHSYRLYATDMAGNQGVSICSNYISYNQPPIAVVDHIYVLKGDTNPFVFNVIANDTDAENSVLQLDSVDTTVLSVFSIPSIPASPTAGDLILSVEANPVDFNNNIKITIRPDIRGTATINYTVRDSQGQSATGKLKIHIVTRNTWIGKSSKEWSLKSNWCGNVNLSHTACNGLGVLDLLPVNTDNEVVVFDESCEYCEADVPNTTIFGMLLDKGFKGRVNQIDTNSITFDDGAFTLSAGYTQWDGNFYGAATSGELHFHGPLQIYGGFFRATKGKMQVENNMIIKNTESNLVFEHNSGLAALHCWFGVYVTANTNNCSIEMDSSVQLYQVELKPIYSSGVFHSFAVTGTIRVANNLLMDNNFGAGADLFINGGTIEARGNISVGSFGIQGTTVLHILNDTTSTQILSALAMGARFPNTIIESNGFITLTSNQHFIFLNNHGTEQPFFKYKKGTFNSEGYFYFACERDHSCQITLESNLTLNNLELFGETSNSTGNVTITNNGFAINVNTQLNYHMHDQYPFNGGLIDAKGLIFNDSNCGIDVQGTTKLKITGANSQIYSVCGTDSTFPQTTIASSGTVQILSGISFGAAVLDGIETSAEIFKISSGSISSTGGTLASIFFQCKNGLTCSIDTGVNPLIYNGTVVLDASSPEAVSSYFYLTKFIIDGKFKMLADSDSTKSDTITGNIYTYGNVRIGDTSNVFFKNPLKLFFKGVEHREFYVFNYNSVPANSVLNFGDLAPTDVPFTNTVGSFGDGVVLKDGIGGVFSPDYAPPVAL